MEGKVGSYIQGALMPDEKVVYEARLHWIVYFSGWLIVAFGILMAPVPPAAIIVIAFGLLVLGYSKLTRATSEFAVTNKRVIIKVGWISRRSIEMNLSKIESVDVQQGLFGRLFGYGKIVVVGTGATREPFARIEGPLEFRRAVQAQTS